MSTDDPVQFRVCSVASLTPEVIERTGYSRSMTAIEATGSDTNPNVSMVDASWKLVGEDEPLGVSYTGDPAFMLRIAVVWQQQPAHDALSLIEIPFVAAHVTHAILRYIPAAEVTALAEKASKRKPGDPGHSFLVGWLTEHIQQVIRAAGDPPSTPEQADLDARSVVSLDRALAGVVAKLGKTGAAIAKKILAARPAAPWSRWRREGGGTASTIDALQWLASVGWNDVVKPRLDREAEDRRKRDATPIRFPQSVGQAVTAGRSATIASRKKRAEQVTCDDGSAWARHVMVDSPEMQLFLEYDGQGPGSTLQSVLTGGLLKTYLLTHAACADQARMNPVDGTFAWDERAVYKKYVSQGKGFGGRNIDLMHEDMKQLLKMRVVALEGIKMAQPEPLVNLYTEEKSGRSIYVHANVVMMFLRERFSQIPRAVLRLDSRDMPLALGLATLARADAVKILAGSNSREMVLAQLAAVCGEDTRAGARKSGTAYWSAILERLQRIAKEGDIGSLMCADVGAVVSAESRVKFSLHDGLAASYAPLVKAHDAHRRLAAGKKAARLLRGTPRLLRGTPRLLRGTPRLLRGKTRPAQDSTNKAVEPSFRGRPRPPPIQPNPS
jgi:hypothetical protein